MKICFVNSFYPPYIGGAEWYVSSLEAELAARGHDVVVYCSKSSESSGSVELIDSVRIHRMETPIKLYGTPLSIFPKFLY